MGLEEIFDQVMEVVFNTANQLQYAASTWLIGPVGGCRLISQSEYLRRGRVADCKMRVSRPPALHLDVDVIPT